MKDHREPIKYARNIKQKIQQQHANLLFKMICFAITDFSENHKMYEISPKLYSNHQISERLTFIKNATG